MIIKYVLIVYAVGIVFGVIGFVAGEMLLPGLGMSIAATVGPVTGVIAAVLIGLGIRKGKE